MLVRRGVAGAAGGASRGGEGVMNCSLAGRPKKASRSSVEFYIPPMRFARRPIRFAEFEVGNRPKSDIKLCKTRRGRGQGKC